MLDTKAASYAGGQKLWLQQGTVSSADTLVARRDSMAAIAIPMQTKEFHKRIAQKNPEKIGACGGLGDRPSFPRMGTP